MTKITKQVETQKALQDFLQMKSLSLSELSVKIGISTATLSNLQTGKFETISGDMLNRIWNYVKPNEVQLVKTANFETGFKACLDAHKRNLMLCLIGEAGYGKTTVLKEYHRKTKNAFYLICENGMKPKEFFRKLLREMGNDFVGTVSEMKEKIALELSKQAGSVILLDEAGKLRQDLLLHIHDLRNQTENIAGIVLAGLPYLKTNLEKALKKQKIGMEEFYSRVQDWQPMSSFAKAEVMAICKANGINDPQQIKNIQSHCREFRMVINEIKKLTYNAEM
jgi:DNA transposition AAA+ family ATPase